MKTRQHPLGLWICSALFFALALHQPAQAQTYNRFTPADGILVGDTSTYVTTPAVSADILALWTGTCSAATYLRGDGACAAVPATVNGANPTATIGLSAVNGVAGTFLRSDGAPALSQSIVPTWTGLHTFNNGIAANAITVGGQDVCLADGTDCPPSGGVPGGSDGQVQYNNGGSFGGEAGFIYDDNDDELTVGNVVMGGNSLRVNSVEVCLQNGTNCPAAGAVNIICNNTACNASTLAVGSYAIVYKTSGTTRTSTTALTDDPVLQFTNLPNTARYLVEADIAWRQNGSTTNGINGYINGTTSAGQWVCRTMANTSAANATETANGPGLGNTLAFTASGSGGATRHMTCSGFMTAVGTGTIAYAWAQASSNATGTIVDADSWMRITRVQ